MSQPPSRSRGKRVSFFRIKTAVTGGRFHQDDIWISCWHRGRKAGRHYMDFVRVFWKPFKVIEYVMAAAVRPHGRTGHVLSATANRYSSAFATCVYVLIGAVYSFRWVNMNYGVLFLFWVGGKWVSRALRCGCRDVEVAFCEYLKITIYINYNLLMYFRFKFILKK